jgi:hypothetical protein
MLTAAVLAASALSVAACGGEATGSGANAGGSKKAARDAELKFARCMRENGVDMPDPSAGGGRRKLEIGGRNADASRATFEKAQEACDKYLKAIKPPEMSPEEEQEFKDAALAHARCIREHGIENFPDPVFGENGQASIRIGKESGIDKDELIKAEEACDDEMPKRGAGPKGQEQGQ